MCVLEMAVESFDGCCVTLDGLGFFPLSECEVVREIVCPSEKQGGRFFYIWRKGRVLERLETGSLFYFWARCLGYLSWC